MSFITIFTPILPSIFKKEIYIRQRQQRFPAAAIKRKKKYKNFLICLDPVRKKKLKKIKKKNSNHENISKDTSKHTIPALATISSIIVFHVTSSFSGDGGGCKTKDKNVKIYIKDL